MARQIRPMTRVDLEMAISWAAAEGWNPGRKDADAFHGTDPAGFLMAVENGEPVACISAVRYGATYGFLGFYIAKPEARGRGHGLAVWNAAMEHFGGRTVGLDGVVDQQPNYARSGFVYAHRNIRNAGAAPSGKPRLPEATTAELLDYDTQFFPADRRTFTTAWLTNDGHVVRSVVDAGRVKGFGVLRPCLQGAKIGPLFADDAATAEVIFRALCAEAGPGPIVLDVPETNPEAVNLAEGNGLTAVFETARMYKGAAPDLPIAKTFGITTFELG
ncbi:MAG: GNAT family N-acetyltransferase [Pseudomonadota bacterium]